MLKFIFISVFIFMTSCQKQLIETITRDRIEILSTFIINNCEQEITVFKDQESLKKFQKNEKFNKKSGPIFIVDFNQFYVIAICKESIGSYEIVSINHYKNSNEIILNKISEKTEENVLLIKVPNTIEIINLKLKE